jgi:mono/diheme cytochrome c family protein
MPAFAVADSNSLSPAQVRAWAALKEEVHAAPRQQGRLTAEQVQALASGIKKRWGSPAPPASVPPYLVPTGSRDGKKVEGERVFERACAGCHGMEGEGVERDGTLRNKINDPDFLALISDQALRRYAITGRPDLGMPPYDGKAGRSPDFQPLTSEEIDGVVALLACWRLGGPVKSK